MILEVRPRGSFDGEQAPHYEVGEYSEVIAHNVLMKLA